RFRGARTALFRRRFGAMGGENVGGREPQGKTDESDPERVRRGKGFYALAATANERIRRAAREERNVRTDPRADRPEVQAVKPPRARESAQHRARVARATAETGSDRNALPYPH